jgi:hypothetical protein
MKFGYARDDADGQNLTEQLGGAGEVDLVAANHAVATKRARRGEDREERDLGAGPVTKSRLNGWTGHGHCWRAKTRARQRSPGP